MGRSLALLGSGLQAPSALHNAAVSSATAPSPKAIEMYKAQGQFHVSHLGNFIQNLEAKEKFFKTADIEATVTKEQR